MTAAIRTDLAMEVRDLRQQAGEGLGGVRSWEEKKQGLTITGVEVLDRAGARALGKPVGRYVTVELGGLEGRGGDIFTRSVEVLAGELGTLLKGLAPGALVLVAGLGNRAITPDTLGPRVHDHMLVTRHLVDRVPEQFGGLRPVASLAAGVLGTTGMESGELIRAACGALKPGAVIAVDALASRSLERLCRTVQLGSAGITPGSGVGNHRWALNEQTLGVPVVAVGAPTVVDGATLAADLTGGPPPRELGPAGSLLVTPKDIDRQVADLAKVIAFAINRALQPGLSLADLELMLS